MRILVTGGAGYVGSIVAEETVKEGHEVIVLDNLQQGHRDAVPLGARFINADICDKKSLNEALNKEKRIDAVMHMAGETVVEYSMKDPRRFFLTNMVGGFNLLEAMINNGIQNIVFSSTAAVYGEPVSSPINEDHPKKPLNSYGETKLIFERILDWYGRAYGLKHISLRYFNASGASARLGEDHRPETHLIPNILKVPLNKNGSVSVFGSDYPTKDGSCVRDYVHVIDIARAHLLALEKMPELSGKAYNLGSGSGYTVLEVIETCKKITGSKIPAKISSRRFGDPAVLVASSHKAKHELGWKPGYNDIESIVKSAWMWMEQHPNGYEK